MVTISSPTTTLLIWFDLNTARDKSTNHYSADLDSPGSRTTGWQHRLALMTSTHSALGAFGSDWPFVFLFGASYFASIQLMFYLSSFTTLAPVAFLPVMIETVRSPTTQFSVDLVALAGVFLGNLVMSLVFGRALVSQRVPALAVTVGFLVLTWVIVVQQLFGEDAVWYHLLATPVTGCVAVVLLLVDL